MTAAPPALAPDLADGLRRLKLAAMRHLAPELLRALAALLADEGLGLGRQLEDRAVVEPEQGLGVDERRPVIAAHVL